MQLIGKLQRKLKVLAPDSKWGVNSVDLDVGANPDDDYDRIVDWVGGTKPTVTEVQAVTNQDMDNASLETEAENAFIQSKTFKTLVKWIADARGITMGQAKTELKDIYKSW